VKVERSSWLTQVIGQFAIDELKQRVQIAKLPFDMRLIHVKVRFLNDRVNASDQQW
jgi:hypothetical protein